LQKYLENSRRRALNITVTGSRRSCTALLKTLRCEKHLGRGHDVLIERSRLAPLLSQQVHRIDFLKMKYWTTHIDKKRIMICIYVHTRTLLTMG